MAHVYIRSGAAGSNNGTSWTNAYTTVTAALAATAGDDLWVAADHAETQASAVNLLHGTAAAPTKMICVNHLGTVPPVSADLRTTATITTTGANALDISGFMYIRGITFNSGSGAVNTKMTYGNNANGSWLSFVNCVTKKNGTTGGATAHSFYIGRYSFHNHTFGIADAGDGLFMVSPVRFEWRASATPFSGAFPLWVFRGSNNRAVIELEGLDFSNAGYASSFFAYNDAGQGGTITVQNCKHHATMGTHDGALQSLGGIDYLNLVSDSAANNYRQEKKNYAGSHVHETTIVRTGGGSDGVTGLAWKIVTTANAKRVAPFESMPLAVKNNTVGSTVTVTVYGVWGGGAVPTSADIWPVVSYMGSSAAPIATVVSGAPADTLAAGTNWTTDSSTWGGSTTKFKMVMTLSSPQPALKGPIYVKICAAAASATFYIDPKIVLS